MKTSQIILVGAILLSGGLGFMIGRNTAPTTHTATRVQQAKAPIAAKEKPIEPTAPESKPADENKQEETTKLPSLPDKPAPQAQTGKSFLARAEMGISDSKISTTLESIALNLEAKRLSYDSGLKQDCSGIFHQIKDSIQAKIPALAQSASYKYPDFKSVRSSRQIADWYYKNKNLLIVEDPIAARNSIRPGSVMFFGRPNKKFSNMDIELLTDRSNSYTKNGAIMHIAVVTSVQTDEDNNVIAYTMMHGRNSRVHASRSGSKEVQSNNTKNLPPFGNWSQQWVAVANIATPI